MPIRLEENPYLQMLGGAEDTTRYNGRIWNGSNRLALVVVIIPGAMTMTDTTRRTFVTGAAITAGAIAATAANAATQSGGSSAATTPAAAAYPKPPTLYNGSPGPVLRQR